ncbi:MAG: hypothetical protein IJP41_09985 [Synergistaceae bacterium]|nr:hypothetical protein [Synergistaceae bacterium]
MLKKSNKNLTDLVDEILEKNPKPYMTVVTLVKILEKRKNEFDSLIDVRRDNIERLVGDSFTFLKKISKYIVRPCEPSELVLNEIARIEGRSPKQIARDMPVTKKDFSRILAVLLDEGRIKIKINEDLEPRIYLNTPVNQIVKTESKVIPNNQFTLEQFKNAFDKLDRGRIFVRICDLRRELKWPREIFDDMLIRLRDDGIIALRVGDASLMTSDEIADCFIDENNFRMGTVTWNGR